MYSFLSKYKRHRFHQKSSSMRSGCIIALTSVIGMLKNYRLNVKPVPAEAIRGWFQHRAIKISGKVRLMNGEKRLFKASRLTLVWVMKLTCRYHLYMQGSISFPCWLFKLQFCVKFLCTHLNSLFYVYVSIAALKNAILCARLDGCTLKRYSVCTKRTAKYGLLR